MSINKVLYRVLRAEEEGRRILEDAGKQSATIIERAREDARALVAQASEEADKEARKLIEDARREANQAAARLREEAARKNAILEERARGRLDAAVDIVLRAAWYGDSA